MLSKLILFILWIDIHRCLSSHDSLKSFDCEKLLNPIRKRREICSQETYSHIVDICTIFSYDYEYMMPFLLHHLNIGVSKIRIYNNDEKISWYNHPAIQCLITEEYVTIQPWYGVGVMVQGMNHCMKVILNEYTRISSDNIWSIPLDIDEYIVFHKNETCINTFVKDKDAPGIHLNWAFFMPEKPNKLKTEFLPTHVNCSDNICLPMETITTRFFENSHIKTIARTKCVETWPNVHYPIYQSSCQKYGKPVDPQGHRLTPDYHTPYVDNYYPIVQLNHYWTLSLSQFMRKIHRGIGDTDKSLGKYRSTNDFFEHVRRIQFVVDNSFMELYGVFFIHMKHICPQCFNMKYYFMKE
jgi:hypothetical protein